MMIFVYTVLDAVHKNQKDGPGKPAVNLKERRKF